MSWSLDSTGIRRLSLLLQARVERHLVPATVLMGLAVAGLAIAYAAGSGKAATEVLYSGQSALGPLLANSAGYAVATLLLLLACRALAYCASLSAFRGGPIFPAMFVGAAGGIALSHLPGLQLTSAFAMGIGAMSVAMLRLPLTSVLLANPVAGGAGPGRHAAGGRRGRGRLCRDAPAQPRSRRRVPRRRTQRVRAGMTDLRGGRPIHSMGPFRGYRKRSPPTPGVSLPPLPAGR